jgi:ATP-dependent Zn proteases
MEENKKNNESPEQRRPDENGEGVPRFNFMWVFILIGLGLLVLQVTKFSGKSEKASWTDIEKWAKKGHIDRFIVVNPKEAYVYIKKDSLGIEDHEKVQVSQKSVFNPDQPHYVMNIGSVEVASSKIDKINEQIIKEKKQQPVELKIEDRINWTAVLVNFGLPILIFIGLWIFILRRMGGGAGGPGGQLFNIGKSKATLFDSNSKVNITFADVAGLDEAKEEVMEVVDFLKNPKNTRLWAAKSRKGSCSLALRAPAKRCWPKLWPARRTRRFSPFQVLTLWKCSWAWARAVCATFSARPAKKRLVLFSLTKSMP